MRPRRMLAVLLGAWLAGSIAMLTVATHNLRSVDSRIEGASGQLAVLINNLGRPSARMLLRHEAAELNRDYFRWWEFAQIGLGVGALALTIAAGSNGSTSRRWRGVVAFVALLVVLAQRFVLTPRIIDIGRAIDFLPQDAWTPERAVFWRLHGLYSGLELLKMGAIAVLAVSVVTARKRWKVKAEL